MIFRLPIYELFHSCQCSSYHPNPGESAGSSECSSRIGSIIKQKLELKKKVSPERLTRRQV